jgi:hypothetical protein
MRPSASATKRIAAPSHRTQHQHTSLRSPYPERTDPRRRRMPIRWQGKPAANAIKNVSEVEHDTDP